MKAFESARVEMNIDPFVAERVKWSLEQAD
jgi:hypothetical protein